MSGTLIILSPLGLHALPAAFDGVGRVVRDVGRVSGTHRDIAKIAASMRTFGPVA